VSNISVDYDVINQKGSPAWFSDTFANLPTAGFKGRMFISTDTFAFYRDTGTGWDLIGGPGTGTLTGSGVSGQVSFFNGTQTITGNNNLFWDNTNSRLGINTATPGAPLDIHGTGTQLQLNGTGSNNSYLVFQNTGASKWRIGNLSPANSFEIYNAATSTYALTIASATNEVVIQQKLTIGGQVSFGSTLTNNTYTYTLPSATGTLALTSDLTAYVTLAGAQTITGAKTFNDYQIFTNAITANSGIAFLNGVMPPITSSNYSGIGGNSQGVSIVTRPVSTNYTNNLYFASSSNTFTFPNATGTLALTSDLSSYLPLTGGTLTGALVINPTNTLTIGLDVASNTTRFRSDNLEGNKRQLEIVMGSGTLVQLTAKGYLANYGTDMAFYTATTGGVNASPGIYITGTNNRVGMGTGSPTDNLEISSASAPRIKVTSTTNSNNAGIYFSAKDSTGSEFQAGIYFVPDTLKYLAITGDNNSTGHLNVTRGGNVLIGTSTDAGRKLNVFADSVQFGDGGSFTYYYNTPSAGVTVSWVINSAERFKINGAGLVTFNNLGTGTVSATAGVLSAVSDMNLKNEDGFINNALEKVMNLKPRYFYWKKETGLPTDVRQLGFYAQEVNFALGEESANTPKNENDKWGIYDRSIIAMLTKAIQELNEKLKRNNIN